MSNQELFANLLNKLHYPEEHDSIKIPLINSYRLMNDLDKLAIEYAEYNVKLWYEHKRSNPDIIVFTNEIREFKHYTFLNKLLSITRDVEEGFSQKRWFCRLTEELFNELDIELDVVDTDTKGSKLVLGPYKDYQDYKLLKLIQDGHRFHSSSKSARK